jgi:hypothetical protein
MSDLDPIAKARTLAAILDGEIQTEINPDIEKWRTRTRIFHAGFKALDSAYARMTSTQAGEHPEQAIVRFCKNNCSSGYLGRCSNDKCPLYVYNLAE